MTERVARKLDFSRKLSLIVAGLIAVGAPVAFGLLHAAQSRAAVAIGAPSFEVVSIKAHPHGYWPTFSARRFTPDGFIWRNTLVEDLIVFAYDLHDPTLYAGPRGRLIPGGAKWMTTDWYDIEAKMSESDIAELGKLSVKQQEAVKRRMLQSMLADRFRLSVHLETKESPAYWF